MGRVGLGWVQHLANRVKLCWFFASTSMGRLWSGQISVTHSGLGRVLLCCVVYCGSTVERSTFVGRLWSGHLSVTHSREVGLGWVTSSIWWVGWDRVMIS